MNKEEAVNLTNKNTWWKEKVFKWRTNTIYKDCIREIKYQAKRGDDHASVGVSNAIYISNSHCLKVVTKLKDDGYRVAYYPANIPFQRKNRIDIFW